MTNEKDANVIHNLFAEYHYADDLGVIKSKLAEYVATVRAEEREAAFRDVKRVIAEAAAKCPVFIFHSKQGKEFLMNALETAATENRKGEG